MVAILLLASALVAVGFAVPPVWFNGDCGKSKYSDAGDYNLPASQIVGGIDARPYEFPWQASIRRRATNSHFCGGIVINERWIVTAAHCMTGETPGVVSVVVGEHQRSATSTVRQTLTVSSIFIHEDYSSRTNQNDIALIKLSADISLNENVWPVCAADPVNDYAYTKCQCSGWGTLVSGGSCCPDILKYTTMNVTTNAFCNSAYPLTQITDDMICASDNSGGNQRDSCQGDSGGPLTVKDANGVFSVVGIVSWGRGCASGYPGVYARVGALASWVTSKIQSN